MLQDGCEKVMWNVVWQRCVHIKKTFLEKNWNNVTHNVFMIKSQR